MFLPEYAAKASRRAYSLASEDSVGNAARPDDRAAPPFPRLKKRNLPH